MRLFDAFVQATVTSPDASTLRGLERRFAERLQIQPSYWSQLKGGSRQIGERLARQFERLCGKPSGWLDQPHGQPTPGHAPPESQPSGTALPNALTTARDPASTASMANAACAAQARDDDELFIVGLVLSCYRRHPQRARARLLELLGEVLGDLPFALPDPAPAARSSRSTGQRAPALGTRATGRDALLNAKAAEDDHALWLRLQTGVAPLKRRT